MKPLLHGVGGEGGERDLRSRPPPSHTAHLGRPLPPPAPCTRKREEEGARSTFYWAGGRGVTAAPPPRTQEGAPQKRLRTKEVLRGGLCYKGGRGGRYLELPSASSLN
jgi:hypothetical protein